MQTNTTAGLRCLAGVAGVVFLSGTAMLIFGDVKGALLTDKHYIAAVIIAGTMLGGHLAHEAWRNGKYPSSFSFGFLFAVGTALVVLSSAGRQGESLALTQAQAEAAEAARADARVGLKRAQAMLGEAQKALADECKTGSGKRCAGIQRTIDVYEAAARGEQAKLDQIDPALIVAADEEKIAEVISTISTASKERVKATAVLVKPFLIALFLEFGAIVSFGFAFRGEKTRLQLVETKSAEPTELRYVPDAELSELNRCFGSDRFDSLGSYRPNSANHPMKPGPNTRFAKEEVLHSLLTQLALGEQFGSQDSMRERFGIPKSTLSNWLGEWERSGVIPARRQVGRYKVLANA
jgi:hypothetical protein